MAQAVRVRFAPSPTGQLHLGGLRTALYNFLFARANKGQFILRIEDTDQNRLVPGCAEQFESILSRYGMSVDEGPSNGGPFRPYVQSQRLDRYQTVVEQLIDAGKAYRCFCSADRLEMLRREAGRRREPPRYDNRCRSLSQSDRAARICDGQSFAIRFKAEKQDVNFTDLNYGAITQEFNEGDFVLMKSDGFPTYHLANVVDDRQMAISHVIRGMEWLSSTNKHVLLYRALEWPIPQLCHLPLLMRSGKKKLSKRDEDAFVGYYDDKGYLPLAVVNFLLRNGAGIRDHDRNRLYSMDELVERFGELSTIGTASLLVDPVWLQKYGALAFRTADFQSELFPRIRDLVKNQADWSTAAKAQADDPKFARSLVDFLHTNEESFSHLSQLIDGVFRFFFWKPESAAKITNAMDQRLAIRLLEKVVQLKPFGMDDLKQLAIEYGIEYPKLLHLLRLALIDNRDGPPIMELIGVLGEGECRLRLESMLKMLRNSE